MNYEAMKSRYNDYLIEQRRWFHAHPEVSEQEFNTSAHIKAELDRMGIEWVPCGLKTGIKATIRGAKPGKCIMLRADMDALSVPEETGYEFASENEGVSHACGHDCHMSCLLTAAAILNDIKDELCGTVVLAFQPSEEMGTGAPAMIAEGILDGVDACYGTHVWADVPAGQISVRSGPTMASADMFEVNIKGQDGHGSQPHLTKDAVVIASAIVQNLQSIVAREIDPTQTAVISVGTINAGTRWNVIAGKAKLTGTTRCFSNEVRAQIPAAMTRVCEETAKAYRGEAEVITTQMVAPTINDPKLAEIVRGAAKKVMGENCLYDYPVTMGGEDFGNYQLTVPGVITMFGIRNPECDAVHPQHSTCFKVDESVLMNAALTHVQVAVDFLNS